jgi:hypothetical protein
VLEDEAELLTYVVGTDLVAVIVVVKITSVTVLEAFLLEVA